MRHDVVVHVSGRFLDLGPENARDGLEACRSCLRHCATPFDGKTRWRTISRGSIFREVSNDLMVRPERSRSPLGQAVTVPSHTSGCESRRGKQASAPRSRLQASGEILPSERSVKSRRRSVGSVKREQSCGPNESEPLQPRDIEAERRGGRAGHVAAKTTDCAWETGSAQDIPGVGKGARSEGLERNRRDPHRQPTSGEGGAYKPRAKGHRAGRESEGLMVPMTVTTITPPEGRGPALVAPAVGGKCEGMTERSNDPSEKARELHDRLCVGAKHRPNGTRQAHSSFAPRSDDPRRVSGLGRPRRSARTPRRPSVSRVPEIGTHGWKGGFRNPGPQGNRA